jgi:LemA protein
MGFLFSFSGLVVVVLIIAIIYYNRIVALMVRVKEGWSDILVQLKRRHDLIGNLVETVKGYAKHEADSLEKVIQARNVAKTVEGGDLKSIAAAEGALRQALGAINFSALAEAYPDLKANTGFLNLQAELSDTENKIAASRRFYNSTVMNLNTAIRQFPGNLMAGMAGAKAEEFFELDQDEAKKAQEAPRVRF